MTLTQLFMLLVVLAAIVLLPRYGFLDRLSAKRARTLYEDALKHVLTCEQRDQNATLESLGGQLGLSPRRVVEIVDQLQRRGLLRSVSGALKLTPEGERLGLHVMRAHRLWERYLADDAGVPLGRLHQAAEKAEHELSLERVEELDAHLGHPQTDPHGDPIPTAQGSLARPEGVALTDWTSDEPAVIVHIEDEPAVIFEQILAADLRPGKTVRVLERGPERLAISDGDSEHWLAQSVAANIEVAPERAESSRPAGAVRLSDLARDQTAEVVEIDPECRGFSRRRLMDLGMTPGARVEVAMENTFGDPRAFRVRGTTIALRKAQARLVWVVPGAEEKAA